MEDLKRYKLGSVIGRGGFAEVWDATDKTDGSQVAIKFVITDLLNYMSRAEMSGNLN